MKNIEIYYDNRPLPGKVEKFVFIDDYFDKNGKISLYLTIVDTKPLRYELEINLFSEDLTKRTIYSLNGSKSLFKSLRNMINAVVGVGE